MNVTEESGHHRDDEIGLERYVLTLIAWWREILLGTLLLGLFGGAASLAVGTIFPDYKASADVAIIRTHTDVSIDDRFRAVATGDIRARGRNQIARRFALLGLVHQGDVARTVFNELTDLWEDDEYSEGDLLESISSELVTIDDVSNRHEAQSDLIRITASADSPEKATIVANTWASEFVRAVNLLYKPVPEDVIVRVRDEMEISEQRYIDLQAELETLMSISEIWEMENQIKLNNLEISSLQEFWNKTTITLANVQINDSIVSLERDYDTRRRAKELLANAKTLRTQIEEEIKANVISNGNGFSNQLLKLQVYTLSGNVPEGLEIVLDGSYPDSANMMDLSSEVDSIMTGLTVRIEQLDRTIESGIKELVSSIEDASSPAVKRAQNQLLTAIAELENDNREISVRLEKTNSQIQTLTQKRDTARETFETLQNEITELRLTSAAAPSELRLASRAVKPSKSSRPSPVFIAAVVGTMGLLILMFVTFVLNSIGIRPFLKKQKTEAVA